MKKDIIVKNEQIVSIIEDSGIANLIKPLINEVYLFDTYIAGTSHIEDQKLFAKMKVNDRLILHREPKNKFDVKAIVVLNEKKEKLGYIPRKDNLIFARLLDAGKELNATVKEINLEDDFYYIKIAINLIDF